METFSALLAICAGNSPASGEFPAQRPVTRSFDVFFDMCLNKRLRKQSWGWRFETLSHPLWRHCDNHSNAFIVYQQMEQNCCYQTAVDKARIENFAACYVCSELNYDKSILSTWICASFCPLWVFDYKDLLWFLENMKECACPSIVGLGFYVFNYAIRSTLNVSLQMQLPWRPLPYAWIYAIAPHHAIGFEISQCPEKCFGELHFKSRNIS